MNDQDRATLAALLPLWRQQRERAIAEGRIERERLSIATSEPQRTDAQVAALQAHLRELWEQGERQVEARKQATSHPCPTCNDAGVVVCRDNPLRPRAIPCPDCANLRLRARIRRQWPLTEAELALGQKSFVARNDAPQMAGVYAAVQAFGNEVLAGTADILSLSGNVGIGKTHLLLRLYAYVDAAGRAVIYRTATRIQTILQTFGYDDVSRADANRRRDIAIHDLTTVPLLLIDEADRARSNGGYYENLLLDILNHRRAARRATVFAGNDLAHDTRGLPAPVLSRARSHGNRFIDLSGVPDARPTLGVRS